MLHFYFSIRRSLLVILLAVTIFLGMAITHPASAAVTNMPSGVIDLNGYMWSSTIGWISLNCKTGGLGGSDVCDDSDYKVTISSIGNLSGFAWSSNIGWIRFGGLNATTFPTTGGVAAVNAQVAGNYSTDATLTLAFDGWARACAGITPNTETCPSIGTNSKAGGWDGWIALRGTNFQLRFQSDGTMFVDNEAGTTNKDGFFWGSTNVGWIAADAGMTWSQVSATLIGDNGCIIPLNGNKCNVTLTWQFSPSSGVNVVVDPNLYKESPVSGIISSSLGSTISQSLYYNTPTVYRVRSGTTNLGSPKRVVANCDLDNDNTWSTTTLKCVLDPTIPPMVTLTTKRSVIRSGSTADLDWSFSGGTTKNGDCVLTGPTITANYIKTYPSTVPVDAPKNSGTLTTGSLTSFSNFNLTCTNAAGKASASVTIEIIPTVTEI